VGGFCALLLGCFLGFFLGLAWFAFAVWLWMVWFWFTYSMEVCWVVGLELWACWRILQGCGIAKLLIAKVLSAKQTSNLS
jgi:hypothetical protein